MKPLPKKPYKYWDMRNVSDDHIIKFFVVVWRLGPSLHQVYQMLECVLIMKHALIGHRKSKPKKK